MRLYLCLILGVLSASPLLAEIVWQNDYRVAQEACRGQNKPLLLFFNGSDWAGPAMKMKHEMLQSSTFQEKAENQFIFLEVDFPKHHTQSDQQKKENENLKKRFNVQELPALVLVDGQERVMGSIRYLPENAEQLALALTTCLQQDQELISGLSKLSVLESKELSRLYQLAQELDATRALQDIIEEGCRKQLPFFCVEKYRLLVQAGEMQSELAKTIRQKLLSFDLTHEYVPGQNIPFSVALIDFQEMSQTYGQTMQAAQPLLDYLAAFSNQDSTHVWRVEMMLAEIFHELGNKQEALLHAEKACNLAPCDIQASLMQSLNQMRAKA